MNNNNLQIYIPKNKLRNKKVMNLIDKFETINEILLKKYKGKSTDYVDVEEDDKDYIIISLNKKILLAVRDEIELVHNLLHYYIDNKQVHSLHRVYNILYRQK